MGREDLAREALTRKSGADQQQIADLETQHAAAAGRGGEAHPGLAAAAGQGRVLPHQKETIKATYTAAEAQTRINEAFSGISEEMGDVGMAIQRAEDKTAQMQARAGAIDELIASGALDSPVSGRQDDISPSWSDGVSSDVESELAALKAEISGGGPPPKALEAEPEIAVDVTPEQRKQGEGA